MKRLADYLTHYYSIDTGPFQSLSALSNEEAIKIMERLCDDTPYGEGSRIQCNI